MLREIQSPPVPKYFKNHRGISLISSKTKTRGKWYTGVPQRKHPSLGPYRRPTPRVLRGSYGGGRFLMGEVPWYQGPHELTGAMLYCKSFWGSGMRVQGLGILVENLELRVEGLVLRL